MATPYWDNSGKESDPPIVGPGASGPLNSTNPWDTVSLGGIFLPGLASVTAKPRRRVQNKKQNGSDGESPTLRGYDNAEIAIQLRIWTPDQLERLRQIIPQIWPRANAPVGTPPTLTAILSLGPTAFASPAAAQSASEKMTFDIDHPALSLLGISQVIVLSVSSLVPSSEKGAMTCTIECREFALPKAKSAVHTPRGAKGPAATTNHFSAAPQSKNAPPAPSQSGDFGPNQSVKPPSGGSS